MIKTSRQVQGDIFALLQGSPLAEAINGSVYRAGMRPRDSRREDAVIVFTSGLSNQIQTGIVTVLIYVPDIDPYSNGVMVEDVARVEEIERMAVEWVGSLTCAVSDYRFSLNRTITTGYEETTPEHFVSVSLHYQYFDND